MAKETYEIKVHPDGMSFLLDRLAADATPLQFVRELTHNSIQAIERLPSRKGRILWTPTVQTAFGSTPKLAIVDNGDGMTGPEMVDYINMLAATSSQQAFDQNFGIGAKISAGVQNPAGMVYVSWKNGTAAQIHFWKDPETGRYGLKPQQKVGRRHDAWTNQITVTKPEIIRDHGTMVILLGQHEGHDTTIQPVTRGATDLGRHWVKRSLEGRYASIPAGIDLRVASEEHPGKFGQGTKAHGRLGYLASESVHNGSVDLPEARAHWWLLKQKSIQRSTPAESRGHVAIIHDDELYGAQYRRSGQALLAQAGIIAGGERVVIYFEPRTAGDMVTATTARASIRVNSEEVPVNEWADAFSQSLPLQLQEYLESVLSHEVTDKSAASIRSRIEAVHPLFRLSALKRDDTGDVNVDHEAETGRRSPGSPGEPTTIKKKPGRKGSLGDALRDTLAHKSEDTNKPYSNTPRGRVKNFDMPAISWVSIKNRGRHRGDDLDDRAAKFDLKTRTLVINEDFRGYRDLVRHFEKEYPQAPKPAVKAVVQEYYSQVLVQAVIGAQSLSRGVRKLATDYMATQLNPDALTLTAIAPRLEMAANIKRALSNKLKIRPGGPTNVLS